MIIDIPLEIAEAIDDILTSWCGELTDEQCQSCALRTENGCYVSVLRGEEIQCRREQWTTQNGKVTSDES